MSQLKSFFIISLVILCMDLSAQEFRLRSLGTTASYEKIFTEIESETDLWFAYVSEDIDVNAEVTVPRGVKMLEQILDEIFAGTPYKYTLKGKHILITKEAESLSRKAIYALPPNRLRSSVNPDAKPPLEEHERYRLLSPGWDSTYTVVRPLAPDGPLEINRQYNTAISLPDGPLYPALAVKTNLLYGVGTMTPNLAFEFGIGKRNSLELFASYHPWKLNNKTLENKKFVHALFRSEFRWWFCERYNGHFLGAHLLGAVYNINRYNVPMLFDKEYRNEGWAVGAGATYGYHWGLSKHWGIEFNIGLGVAYMSYDRLDCTRCSRLSESKKKVYVGPTRAAISLVYIIK